MSAISKKGRLKRKTIYKQAAWQFAKGHLLGQERWPAWVVVNSEIQIFISQPNLMEQAIISGKKEHH